MGLAEIDVFTPDGSTICVLNGLYFGI
jgi:hypothetical protein